MVLALLIMSFFYLSSVYSTPTNHPQSLSAPLHINTAVGNQATQQPLEGEDLQHGERRDHSAQNLNPPTSSLAHDKPEKHKGKAGRPMKNPNSNYQKRKANAVRDVMIEGVHDKRTAEKTVLARWAYERKLAYALKPRPSVKKVSNTSSSGKDKNFATSKTDISFYRKRFGRNIKKGLNEDQAAQEARLYVVKRRQSVANARKKFNDKMRLQKSQFQKDKSPAV